MSAYRGRRNEDHEEHEEHVNHEAWVIPYADMLTLLMCLFLVLFAIGRTDATKAKLAAQSFQSQLNGTGNVILKGGVGVAPLSGGNGVLDNSGAAVPTTEMAGIAPVIVIPPTTVPLLDDMPTTTSPADRALEAETVALAAAQTAVQSMTEIQDFLQAAADANGIGDQLGFTLEGRGLVVTIITDQVLFVPGRAELQDDGVTILDLVTSALASIPNQIAIEGHTDSKPISTSRFPSNWELSTARATSVLRYLIDVHHLDPLRLSAGGYADTRPIGDNSTDAGTAQNRRVEIVVLAEVSLQPALDAAAEPS